MLRSFVGFRFALRTLGTAQRALLPVALVAASALGAGCVTRTVYVVDDRENTPAPVARRAAEPERVVVESDRGGGGTVAYESDAGITDESDFYEPLSSYGSWIAYPGYGRVWRPSVTVVGAGFRPYTNGHWEHTEWGWTWVDHHPFGWATGHYGRWLYDTNYGWVWTPGTQWSPAWVTWRTGGGYVGWAAMPPGSVYGGSYSVYDTSWVFVSNGNMGVAWVGGVIVTGGAYRTCYMNTYDSRGTYVVYGRPYYRGPDYYEVRRAGRVIHRPLEETEREHPVSRPPTGTTIARGRDRDRDPTSDGRDRPRDGSGGSDNGRPRDGGNDNGRPRDGNDSAGGDNGRPRDGGTGTDNGRPRDGSTGGSDNGRPRDGTDVRGGGSDNVRDRDYGRDGTRPDRTTGTGRDRPDSDDDARPDARPNPTEGTVSYPRGTDVERDDDARPDARPNPTEGTVTYPRGTVDPPPRGDDGDGDDRGNLGNGVPKPDRPRKTYVDDPELFREGTSVTGSTLKADRTPKPRPGTVTDERLTPRAIDRAPTPRAPVVDRGSVVDRGGSVRPPVERAVPDTRAPSGRGNVNRGSPVVERAPQGTVTPPTEEQPAPAKKKPTTKPRAKPRK